MMRRKILPTVPSPTITHLIVGFADIIFVVFDTKMKNLRRTELLFHLAQVNTCVFYVCDFSSDFFLLKTREYEK